MKKLLLLSFLFITLLSTVIFSIAFFPTIYVVIASKNPQMYMDKNVLYKSSKSTILNFFDHWGLKDNVQDIKQFFFPTNLSNTDTNNMGKYKLLKVGDKFSPKNLGLIVNANNHTSTKNMRSFKVTGNSDQSRYYEVEEFDKLPKIKAFKTIKTRNLQTIRLNDGVNVQSSPLYHNENLYFPTRDNGFVSYNLKKNDINFHLRFLSPPARRGFLIVEQEETNQNFIIFHTGNILVKIDAKTGKYDKQFGLGGYLKIGFATSAPKIFNDTLILSINNPSKLIGVNIITGETIWERPLSSNFEGATPWGGQALDNDTGIIYVSTGNPRPPLYGAKRPGENLFANSILAIDALTGKIIWYFQDVIHDLWDFDVASPPSIISLNDEKKILIVPSKRGSLIAVDLNEKRLINNLNYLNAPSSTVPGEITSAVQPLLSSPDNYMSHELKWEDLRKNLDPDEIKRLRKAKLGWFATPELFRDVYLFGLHGGATWPGLAVDKKNKRFYIAVNRMPWRLDMFLQGPNKPHKTTNIFNDKGKDIYKNTCQNCHGPYRNGYYKSKGEERTKYVPSLIGLSFSQDFDELINNNIHPELNLSEYDYLNIKNYFKLLDESLLQKELIDIWYQWSMALDKNSKPITEPPYGFIKSYELPSFKSKWEIPLGGETQVQKNKKVTGQPINGGMAILNGRLMIVTGMPDKVFYGIDLKTGEISFQEALNYSGSAPPYFFQTKEGKTFLAITSTGGKFSGYDNNGDELNLYEVVF